MAASLGLSFVQGTSCNKTAGVKELYSIPVSDLVSITPSTTYHSVTDITFQTAGNGFGRIYFKRGECEVTESFERENEVTVNFAVPNPTKEQRFELEKIRKACEQVMVARLYDRDELLIIGYDAIGGFESFATFQSEESTTGRAKTDDNLTQFNMVALQSELIRTISSLTGAGATTTDDMVVELLAATNV